MLSKTLACLINFLVFIGDTVIALFAFVLKILIQILSSSFSVFRKNLIKIRPKNDPLPTSNGHPKLKTPKPRLPKFIPPRFLWFAAGFILAALFFLIFNTYSFLLSLPNPKLLVSADIPVSTKIYDRNYNLLFQIYADENREIVRLEDLPTALIQATLAIEDRHFYSHPGVNFVSTARAAKKTFLENSTQGGSTITQQLIRASLLTPEKTLNRKIKEIILALWAEKLYTKDQILEMYFNQIAYGGTSYGIKSASQTYFGKAPKNLTLAEAALLAGLPSAPSAYAPFTNPELAKIRQSQVLTAMVDNNFITPQTAQTAQTQKLNYLNPYIAIKAPHFVMYVKNLLVQQYGLRMVEQGGLEVITSLDLPTQELVQEKITVGVNQQKDFQVKNGAALVANPKTGEILAMIGSVNFFSSEIDGYVNVVTSLRSPGSAIKPITYAAALESRQFTAASIINDTPITYQTPGAPPYTPGNYDHRFHGPVTLRTALGNSFNIPAVKVLNQLGLDSMINLAESMGITSWQDRSRFGLALTLGGGEVTMLDLSTAYSVLANQGQRASLNPILKITDYRGRILEDRTRPALPALSAGRQKPNIIFAGTAFILSDILADNNARVQTFGPNSVLNIPDHRVSVKTGTTQTTRDNWTIGFTHTNPQYLTAVWIGNNDNSPMSQYLESGRSGAAPIWRQIMDELLKDKQDISAAVPNDIIKKTICVPILISPVKNLEENKENSDENRQETAPKPIILRLEEYFLQGTEPQNNC